MRRGAFTLVEVVVAIGVFAVTIVAAIGLLSPISRSVTGVSDYDKAAQLGDAIQAELVRLRDLEISGDKLDALHAGSFSNGATLRLVASRGGARAIREADADDAMAGVALRDRYFLIELREQPPPLNYTANSNQGFLAVTATVKWPYQIAAGPNSGDATAADIAQASSLLLNFAIPP